MYDRPDAYFLRRPPCALRCLSNEDCEDCLQLFWQRRALSRPQGCLQRDGLSRASLEEPVMTATSRPPHMLHTRKSKASWCPKNRFVDSARAKTCRMSADTRRQAVSMRLPWSKGWRSFVRPEYSTKRDSCFMWRKRGFFAGCYPAASTWREEKSGRLLGAWEGWPRGTVSPRAFARMRPA